VSWIQNKEQQRKKGKGEYMAIQNAEDLFVTMLSKIHGSEQRLQKVVDELSQAAQDQDVKDILSVRAYLTQQDVSNIEKCFQLLGKQPVQPDYRFADVWVEDVRRELGAIQNPTLKTLYALDTARKIQNYHIGQYGALTLMASVMGNEAVTTLLEHCLADKVQFVEHTRELFREVGRRALGAKARERVRERVEERMSA
jgi:ferritin-like metal-binding protein YciE